MPPLNKELNCSPLKLVFPACFSYLEKCKSSCTPFLDVFVVVFAVQIGLFMLSCWWMARQRLVYLVKYGIKYPKGLFKFSYIAAFTPGVREAARLLGWRVENNDVPEVMNIKDPRNSRVNNIEL